MLGMTNLNWILLKENHSNWDQSKRVSIPMTLIYSVSVQTARILSIGNWQVSCCYKMIHMLQ